MNTPRDALAGTSIASHAIPARLNLVIAAAQLVALIALLLGSAQVRFWPWVPLLAIGYALVMNSAYLMLHEAEHGLLHPNRAINDVTGTLLALFFPAPFHLLRQGHLGHHVRNRSDDEAFDLYFAEDHAVWKWGQFYGILAGFYWAVVAFGNVVAVAWPSLLRQNRLRFDRPTA